MAIFVDTSAWYAVADAGDASHERASALLNRFSGDLVTSDHVLVETWFLVSSRKGAALADQLTEMIRRGIARVESAGLADLEVAAEIGRAFSDQDFSIVDRTSWSIMERLGIHQAVAFDIDFFVYRFGPNRSQAFTVYT